jgi:hypothetical protein
MARKIFFAIAIAVVLLVFLSGCTTPPVAGTCGNGEVEFGEQCDETDCPAGQLCEQCQCKTVTPPALPE